MKDIVVNHFSEWGDLDSVKVLEEKGVAFVTYMNRTNAEFAKEAMDRQSLNNNEILNIRWAFDDPNEKAKQAYKRKAELMAYQAMISGDDDLPAEFNQGVVNKLDQMDKEREEREQKRRALVYGDHENSNNNSNDVDGCVVDGDSGSKNVTGQNPQNNTSLSDGGGILSIGAFEALKKFSKIDKQPPPIKENEPASNKEVKKATTPNLASMLGDYASDDESSSDSRDN
ncbi:Pre-mRNA-splicing factor [Mycoemilia scoparia]|uniref:Pre-mRNA-splicing factor n=1 Tax=Mycoemilia scoparia TaxID=417184 RepID=A0A9W7ZWS8_9FUNG|nr:Pre-mRNA-splicing factor [Mycoemilia scoparia]